MRALGWLVAIVALASLSGCDRSKVRFLGMWNGQFAIDSVDGRKGPNEVRAYSSQCFLQLYAGGNFKMGLRNQAQTLDMAGSWKFSGHRATLSFTGVTFDETSVDELKALGRPFIPPSDFRDSFGRGLIFDISKDGKRLIGLKIDVGKLVGRYEFHKGQG